MNEAKPICEQADGDFYKSLLALRKICHTKIFGTSTGCWCYNYNGPGDHYACSLCREPTEFDKLGKDAVVSVTAPGPVDSYCED